MNSSDFPVEKITNAGLRRLALEEPDEVASVLITVDVPDPKVELVLSESQNLPLLDNFGARSYRPMGFVSESAELKQERISKIEEATRVLTRILGDTPHWLDAPHAFVARVTGRQLREIARSSLVRLIEPNRQLGSRHS